MRLFTWNIRHGGNKKTHPGIVETIAGHNPDVLVLTEYREKAGKTLQPALHDAGWKFQLSSHPPARKNGLLVAAKSKIEELFSEKSLNEEHRIRWIEFHIAGSAVKCLAVYIPDHRENDATGKEVFWKKVVAWAESNMNEKTIIIGDFNTGLKIDAEGAPFRFSEYMEQLIGMGWIDSWRQLNPEKRDFTWYSSAKNGFRLDYAYLSPLLGERLIEARLSHEERLAGLSDHSSLIVDVGEE